MKSFYTAFVAFTFLGSLSSGASTGFSDCGWTIDIDKTGRSVSISKDGETLVFGAHASAVALDGIFFSTEDYPEAELLREPVTDDFGSGMRYTVSYFGAKDKPDMEQSFFIYPGLPYMLVEAAVKGKGLEIIEISPIVSNFATSLPLGESENRIFDMPFDNDNWATFNTVAWSDGKPVTSCEASAFFNVADRKGIVIGSVDHSVWKSAVLSSPAGVNTLAAIELKGGYIGPRTWDVPSGDRAKSTHHGPVKGDRVASPKFMIGVFDDWREGMESYGDANTVLCPRYDWNKDKSVFGWQSWGGMEFGLNYNSAMSVLDFFEKELLPIGFHNEDGRCHIVLDSGWNALNDDQLRSFVTRCKSLGLVPGIYTTPFSYWGSTDDAVNHRQWEGADLADMVLKTNGEYRKITGVSLDPTHPAVKEWNRKTFQKFRDLGFEFVKIDFLNNGSQEADSHFLPEVTTGMQAYNYGMDYVKEFAGDMMLDISIGPVFPAKSHMRRIGCDAWGDLPQSMYTLNCINGSWWLDRVYNFNDPDHLVLSKVPLNGKGSNDEQEARIRYSCGLITGMTLFGGTYAYEGDTKRFGDRELPVVGSDKERARAVKFASNGDLTRLGREGRSFRPVEGTFSYAASLYSDGDVRCDNEFVLDADDAFYYAIFNFNTDGNELCKAPDFARLGIDPARFSAVKELWFGESFTTGELKITVPSKDVRIYRFDKK